jgi:hypothetical protein
MPQTVRAQKGRTMHVTTTPRGLQRISFVDHNDIQAILEQTSGIDYGNPTHDEPGTSFVLLGRKDATCCASVILNSPSSGPCF